MAAVNTGINASQLPDDLHPLLSLIEANVPAGVGKGRGQTRGNAHASARQIGLPSELSGAGAFTQMDQKHRDTAGGQLGTLGSGNHFIEVSLDENNAVWIVLHSGSRGVGNKLATEHIKVARGLMRELLIELEDADLAYLVEGTPEFDAYIADMLWAQDYAAENRAQKLGCVLRSLQQVTEPFTPIETINTHHNFTQRETHFGRDVWLTRKGAIQAREGELGIIPGSMGTSTFIVRGLGNPQSYHSCSHGAGRRLSRTAARKRLSVESLHEQMGSRVWNSDNADRLLDEHPDSYKDVNQVMADQSDLVEVVHTLKQVLNYKGT